ncbi:LysR family transcriptional regulator [Vogesella sp. LIG4]|uniref:LysR family transcriptional regulator n=1 Tax=Vogesella sp. LIG4 TaxID=1192162 RepID=UPI00081F97C4|nr:LysR family transcriptional regulator [Vogesella sp. LIG4]SCK30137.1 DNA-binding transcriptional regulator, LysR family [Vogesella sp. LIG4]
MKLSLDALEVLDAIDRHGSFAAAGEALFKVPSAISYMVGKLEDDLGVTLFDRSGLKAKLTPTGRAVLEDGRRLLRGAIALERRARKIEAGWESELRIAVDVILPFRILLPYIATFYGENTQTRLLFSHEVSGGPWDALLDGRADLAIGALDRAPNLPGFSSCAIGQVQSAFAVAPGHPLADAEQPLDRSEIGQYRLVEIQDTSRHGLPRPLELQIGQDFLLVPNLEAKLQAVLAGVGCGFLPSCLVQHCVDLGKLKVKEVKEPRAHKQFFAAWNTGDAGLGVQWWVEKLSQGDFINDELIVKMLAAAPLA